MQLKEKGNQHVNMKTEIKIQPMNKNALDYKYIQYLTSSYLTISTRDYIAFKLCVN